MAPTLLLTDRPMTCRPGQRKATKVRRDPRRTRMAFRTCRTALRRMDRACAGAGSVSACCRREPRDVRRRRVCDGDPQPLADDPHVLRRRQRDRTCSTGKKAAGAVGEPARSRSDEPSYVPRRGTRACVRRRHRADRDDRGLVSSSTGIVVKGGVSKYFSFDPGPIVGARPLLGPMDAPTSADGNDPSDQPLVRVRWSDDDGRPWDLRVITSEVHLTDTHAVIDNAQSGERPRRTCTTRSPLRSRAWSEWSGDAAR